MMVGQSVTPEELLRALFRMEYTSILLYFHVYITCSCTLYNYAGTSNVHYMYTYIVRVRTCMHVQGTTEPHYFQFHFPYDGHYFMAHTCAQCRWPLDRFHCNYCYISCVRNIYVHVYIHILRWHNHCWLIFNFTF